jgi:cytochrome c oxidase subunit II
VDSPPSGYRSTTPEARPTSDREPAAATRAGQPGSARTSRRGRRRWWAVVAVATGGLLLAGCQLPSFGAHTPISNQGNDSLKLWQGFFIAGAAVFVFVFCLIAWATLRYRRRSDRIPRQTQYHTVVEIFYTAVPIVFVLILFAFTFVTENEVDALPTPNMAVTVTAFQWGWRFHYTTKHVTVIGVELQDPEMVLPAHESVRIYLESADVVHGFYVPALLFSRYAQPGVVNKFTVNLTTTGTFRGQCTQYCGLYHSLMRFRVKVVSDSQFSAWVRTHHTTGPDKSISTAERKALATSTKHSYLSTGTGGTGGTGS